MLLNRTNAMRVMCFILGGLGAATLAQPLDVVAQGTVEPQVAPSERGAVEQETGTAPTTPTPRTDQAIAEQERRTEQERRADQERLARAQRYRDDHRHHGETYIAGFGGVTFGGTTTNMEGRGSALGASIDNPSRYDAATSTWDGCILERNTTGSTSPLHISGGAIGPRVPIMTSVSIPL